MKGRYPTQGDRALGSAGSSTSSNALPVWPLTGVSSNNVLTRKPISASASRKTQAHTPRVFGYLLLFSYLQPPGADLGTVLWDGSVSRFSSTRTCLVRGAAGVSVSVARFSGVFMSPWTPPLTHLHRRPGVSSECILMRPKACTKLASAAAKCPHWWKNKTSYRRYCFWFKMVAFWEVTNQMLSESRTTDFFIQAQSQGYPDFSFLMRISVIWEAGTSERIKDYLSKDKIIRKYASFSHSTRRRKVFFLPLLSPPCSCPPSLLSFFLSFFHSFLPSFLSWLFIEGLLCAMYFVLSGTTC